MRKPRYVHTHTHSLTHSLTLTLSWQCVVCSAGSVWVMSECLVWTWWFWMDSHRVTSTDTSVSSDTWETNTAQWVTHTDIIIVTQTLLTAVTDQCCVSQRWTLVPSSGDLLTSDLLSAEVAVCDEAAKTRAVLPGEWFVPRRSVGCWWSVSHDPLCVAAVLRWHPVIRRFGLSTAGLTSFLLTQQEMIKQHYPVKGETHTHTHTHIWDMQHTHMLMSFSHHAVQVSGAVRGMCVQWATAAWLTIALCLAWTVRWWVDAVWTVLWLAVLFCPLIGRSDLSFDWPFWSVLWLAVLICPLIGRSDLSCDWPIWTVIGRSWLCCDWPILTVLWLADLDCAVIGRSDLSFDWPFWICPLIGRSELWLADLICPLIGRSDLSFDWPIWTVLWLADLICPLIGRSELCCDWPIWSVLWLADLNCAVIGRSVLCCVCVSVSDVCGVRGHACGAGGQQWTLCAGRAHQTTQPHRRLLHHVHTHTHTHTHTHRYSLTHRHTHTHRHRHTLTHTFMCRSAVLCVIECVSQVLRNHASDPRTRLHVSGRRSVQTAAAAAAGRCAGRSLSERRPACLTRTLYLTIIRILVFSMCSSALVSVTAPVFFKL